MNLGIDITSIPPQPAGIGVYIINLARSLITHAPQCGFSVFIFGRRDQGNMPEFQGGKFIACSVKSRGKRIFWEQAFFPRLLRRYAVDLIHSPNYTVPVLARCKKVCTIHDLTCMKFPTRRKFWHGLFFRKMIGVSVHCADFIITDSKNTEKDVVAYFPGACKKIRTVYPACNAFSAAYLKNWENSASLSLGIKPEYFLFVSTIEPSKNLARLIDAFEMFKSSTRSNVCLVIVGKFGWDYESILVQIKKSLVAHDIKLLGYQTTEVLSQLYKNALALIYPSLYEGFGIPPLEAMSVRTPVLASNASSIPEVVGDAALLFNPEDTNEIRQRMEEIYTSKELRIALAEKGVERTKLFSWDKSAEETIAIYQYVLSQKQSGSP